jgi:uncharacterized cupin superfamily protein
MCAAQTVMIRRNTNEDCDPEMMIEKIQGVTTAPLPDLGVPNVEAWGKDFVTGNSGYAPITCGMFRLNKGEALPYDYEFDEFKLVLEGEFTVKDQTGACTTFKAGDVMQFKKGTRALFSTDSSGLAFYVAQR